MTLHSMNFHDDTIPSLKTYEKIQFVPVAMPEREKTIKKKPLRSKTNIKRKDSDA